jgi:hypothetical protein
LKELTPQAEILLQHVREQNVLVYRKYSDLQERHVDMLRGVASPIRYKRPI